MFDPTPPTPDPRRPTPDAQPPTTSIAYVSNCAMYLNALVEIATRLRIAEYIVRGAIDMPANDDTILRAKVAIDDIKAGQSFMPVSMRLERRGRGLLDSVLTEREIAASWPLGLIQEESGKLKDEIELWERILRKAPVGSILQFRAIRIWVEDQLALSKEWRERHGLTISRLWQLMARETGYVDVRALQRSIEKAKKAKGGILDLNPRIWRYGSPPRVASFEWARKYLEEK
jgi:hypothetical protein